MKKFAEHAKNDNCHAVGGQTGGGGWAGKKNEIGRSLGKKSLGRDAKKMDEGTELDRTEVGRETDRFCDTNNRDS